MSIHQKLSLTRAIAETDDAARNAWTTFWREQPTGSRCLQAASGEVRNALGGHWKKLAARLPGNPQIVDLGCGSGVVGMQLLTAHIRATITGVDAAQIAFPPRPRMKIHDNVYMESLPFPDAYFGAAVSQFGFEYSRTELAALEVARVLKTGAALSLLVHHSESPIVKAEAEHERALRELTSDEVSVPFLSGHAVPLRRALDCLEWRYHGNSAISLAAKCLRAKVALPEGARATVWRAVLEALAPELVLCGHLRSSCVSREGIYDWMQPLRGCFRNLSASPLNLMGEPLAWAIEGVRAH